MVAHHGGPQKPRHIRGYSESHTEACERTLLTLIANLGPWRDCIYLIGGLVPKYLVPVSQGSGQQFVPTMDVDLVLDIQMLANVEAYRRLEANLSEMGFTRDANDQHRPVNYRWIRRIDERTTVTVDLLCDVDARAGSAVPIDSGVSALVIPGAHLAYRDFVEVSLSGALLEGKGFTRETLRVANVVPFVVLKALAYAERKQEKDAHDLIYVLREYVGGPDAVASQFALRLREWDDEPLLITALELIRTHFDTDKDAVGNRKNGSVSYATFHLVLGDHRLEARLRNEASAIADRFIDAVMNDNSSALP
jgi:hypothetical protein